MKTKLSHQSALTGLVLFAALAGLLTMVAVRSMEAPPAERVVPGPRTESSFEARAGASAKTRRHGDEGSYRLNAAPRASRDSDGHYVYDADADRLTLRVRDVPMAEVLEAISQRTGLTFDTRPGLSLENRVTLRVERLPLDEAVRDLLRGFNFVLSYDSSNAGVASSQLTRVLIVSASPSEAIRQARADLLEDSTGALLDAVARNDRAAAKTLAEALRAFSRETGIPLSSAADALLQNLDEGNVQSYAAALRILKELAPEQAAEELIRRLGDADAEGGSQGSVMAAWGLGVVGSDSSMVPLRKTLESPNHDLRLASANSLQQIRHRSKGREDADYLERPPPTVIVDEYAY